MLSSSLSTAKPFVRIVSRATFNSSVELMVFGGLKIDEAAEVVGVSPRTVDRDWRYARVWLFEKMLR